MFTPQQEVRRLLDQIRKAVNNPIVKRATDEIEAIAALSTLTHGNDQFLMRVQQAAKDKYPSGCISPSGLLSCAMILALQDCEGCSPEGQTAYVRSKMDSVYRAIPTIS